MKTFGVRPSDMHVDASSDSRRELAGFASSFITAIDLGVMTSRNGVKEPIATSEYSSVTGSWEIRKSGI